jgi:hypothetical protein
MTSDDDLLDFHYAVMGIRAKLGGSLGKAQSVLRQLCASGEVRSQKQPHNTSFRDEFIQWEGPPEDIEPSEWREREIDLMTDDNGCRYLVNVSKSDFRYWLDQQPTAASAKPRPKSIKREKIKAWLAKKFNNKTVPDDRFRNDLLNELRGCDDRLLKQIDDATFKKAIQEYHAELISAASSPSR